MSNGVVTSGEEVNAASRQVPTSEEPTTPLYAKFARTQSSSSNTSVGSIAATATKPVNTGPVSFLRIDTVSPPLSSASNRTTYHELPAPLPVQVNDTRQDGKKHRAHVPSLTIEPHDDP